MMTKYQELILRYIAYNQAWEQARYDIDAYPAYTIDSLAFIDTMPVLDRVLDVGCAYGTMPAYLSSIGWKEVYAVDIGPLPNVNFLLEHNVTFQQVDIEYDDMPAWAGNMDLVVFTEVLEHLRRHPDVTIKKLVSTMKIGGKLLLSTPNIKDDSWKSGGAYQRDPYRLTEYKNIPRNASRDLKGDIDRHYYVYDIDEVRHLMMRLGLEIEVLEKRQRHIYCIAKRTQ